MIPLNYLTCRRVVAENESVPQDRRSKSFRNLFSWPINRMLNMNQWFFCHHPVWLFSYFGDMISERQVFSPAGACCSRDALFHTVSATMPLLTKGAVVITKCQQGERVHSAYTQFHPNQRCRLKPKS